MFNSIRIWLDNLFWIRVIVAVVLFWMEHLHPCICVLKSQLEVQVSVKDPQLILLCYPQKRNKLILSFLPYTRFRIQTGQNYVPTSYLPIWRDSRELLFKMAPKENYWGGSNEPYQLCTFSQGNLQPCLICIILERTIIFLKAV